MAVDKLPYFVQEAKQVSSEGYCACGCDQLHHMNVTYTGRSDAGMEWRVLYFMSNSHKAAYLRKQRCHV